MDTEPIHQELENPWSDLPGKFYVRLAQQGDEFIRNAWVVIVEQDLGPGFKPRVYAGWFAIPASLLADIDPPTLHWMAQSHLDHIFRPWLRPDRPVIAPFDLFPRTAALWRRIRERVNRGLRSGRG